MSGDPLLPHVRALVSQRIESVAQLDLLLFLHGQRDRVWSAAQISAELRISPDWTSAQLDRLADRGFLKREGGGFSFSAGDLDAAVGDLAKAYRAFPVTVVGAIYPPGAKENEGLKRFADAFRLWSEPGREDRDG